MAYKSTIATMAWVFFERFVKSMKELLRKELKAYRLTYNKLQTVLFEIKAILKNRPITLFMKMRVGVA